jgi:hypothetical protein
MGDPTGTKSRRLELRAALGQYRPRGRFEGRAAIGQYRPRKRFERRAAVGRPSLYLDQRRWFGFVAFWILAHAYAFKILNNDIYVGAIAITVNIFIGRFRLPISVVLCWTGFITFDLNRFSADYQAGRFTRPGGHTYSPPI